MSSKAVSISDDERTQNRGLKNQPRDFLLRMSQNYISPASLRSCLSPCLCIVCIARESVWVGADIVSRVLQRNLNQRTAHVVSPARTFNSTRTHCALDAFAEMNEKHTPANVDELYLQDSHASVVTIDGWRSEAQRR